MKCIKKKRDLRNSMKKKVKNYLVLLFFLVAVLVYFLVTFDIGVKEGISIRLSPTEVIFNWQDKSNNENGFRVGASTDPNFGSYFRVCDVGSNVETCNYLLAGTVSSPPLVVGTTYHFKVYAYNGNGNSGYATTSLTIPTQCQDTFDNDKDGVADYPADFSCSSASDNDETNPLAQCQDGRDNDGDTFVDYPADLGCSSLQDNDEVNAPVVACGNGIVEQGEECDDNNLNNNDGCSSTCTVESGYTCTGTPSVCTVTPPSPPGPSGPGGGGGGSSPTAQCRDRRDNDNDGLCDFAGCRINGVNLPADIGCSSLNDNSEVNAPSTGGLGGTPTPPGLDDTQPSEEENEQTEGIDTESPRFRLIFWLIVGVISIGIVVVVLLLIRALRMSNNFKSLAGLSKSLDGAPKTGKGSSSGNNS